MAQKLNLGNSIRPLRNVAALAQLVKRLEGRAFGLPGMATFHGLPGLGKSYACAYAAANLDCIHVTLQRLWTSRTLLEAVLLELSLIPKKTNAAMMRQVNEGLAIAGRTLLIDEADYAVEKGMVEIIRDMHDGSQVPVVLIGMELLPQKLRKWELIHGRMLSWVGAEAADLRDARMLAELYAPDLALDDPLLERIMVVSKGSARRISTNLAFVQEQARLTGQTEMSLLDWGNQPFLEAEAPAPREIAI